MPPDETESAVAAWLDSPSTQREITVARRRLAKMGFDCNYAWLLALGIEILAELTIYGDPGGSEDPVFPEPDDDEPWRKS